MSCGPVDQKARGIGQGYYTVKKYVVRTFKRNYFHAKDFHLTPCASNLFKLKLC
jgi:hypothetical protein